MTLLLLAALHFGSDIPAMPSLRARSAQQSDDEKKILALIDELRTDDAAARRKALEGLLDLQKLAVPLGLKVLADERPGLEAQVDELVKKLASKEWKERDAAHQALVRIGRRARERLQTHEGAQDAEVSWRVKAVLAEIEEKERGEATFEYVRNTGLCEFLGRAGDGSAVPLLLRQLETPATPNPAIADAQLALRVRAAEALGLLRSALSPEQVDVVGERTVEILVTKPELRQAAVLIQTLGRLRSMRPVREMLAYLKDSDRKNVHLKGLILQALAAIGDAEGVAGIVRALGSEDVYVRYSAIEVLAGMAGTDFGLDARAPGEVIREKARAAQKWWEKKYGREWQE